jgi:hypothetical protein
MSTRKENVKASKILFIRLGEGNSHFDRCKNNGEIILEYKDVDHQSCMDKKWDAVRKHYTDIEKTTKTAASNHIKQLEYFYHADADTVWITFHDNKMWWCKANMDIKRTPENMKKRSCSSGWSDCDITGQKLFMSEISGQITAKRGFLGTICEFDSKDKDYIISRINGLRSDDNNHAFECFQNLQKALIPLIESLSWRDFELLVDLILRHVGWDRVSEVGGTQKTLDIDLVNPLTGERAWVQVKSRANKKVFEEHTDKLEDNGKLFFFTHSPTKDLEKHRKNIDNKNIVLLFAEEIAEMAMSAGLAGWIIKRTQ